MHLWYIGALNPRHRGGSALTQDLDRWTQQVRKGSTRLAVLQLLREQERYGYEIIAELKERTRGALELAESNVYPALHALEAEGSITSCWKEVEPGVPPRKYYRLTPRGKALHEQMVKEWKEYAQAIARLLKGGT